VKSSIWDYVLSGTWITVLTLLAVAAVWTLTPTLRWAFGDYHVLAGAALFFAVFGIVCGVAVRGLMRWRPIASGTYDFDSREFAHWKLVTVLYHLGRGALRPLAPFFLQPLVDAVQGASIGKDVAFGGAIDDPYFVTVGSRVVLGHNSLISGSYLWDGKLTCGTVLIADDVTIGANAIVFPSTVIGAGANVMNGAVVMPGTVIAAGETWRGNPARKWT
jgi:serine acetyltransferase